jgi:hypothetical protein
LAQEAIERARIHCRSVAVEAILLTPSAALLLCADDVAPGGAQRGFLNDIE